MSGLVPIEIGDPEQRIEIVLGDVPVVMRVRWNSRDDAWYLDIWEIDGKTEIAMGVKVVVGALLRGRVAHRLYAGALFAVDDSGDDVEPGLYDLGGRVTLWYLDANDRRLAETPVLEVPKS